MEIDTLGGQPGVRTADYALAKGGWPKALSALDEQLGLSRGRRPAATAVCALVLISPEGHMRHSEARVRGHLHWPPHAELPGFAAVFVTDGEPFSLDGVLLHRRRAFEQLLLADEREKFPTRVGVVPEGSEHA